MELIVLGSNSAGNGYLLRASNGDTLLIECGVPMKRIKEALNFDLSRVSCIVSHCHGDHASSISDVLKSGISVWSNAHTLEEKGVRMHYRANILVAGITCHIEGFRVKAFDVNHDVPCHGFLISHPECGLVLFLTDTYYCDYTFPGLNNIIIECNHDTEIIDTNGTPGFLRDRIIQSHMNLKTCKELLAANDLSKVNNIVLIHLSDSNSNQFQFRKEIRELTGKTVHIAERGKVIPFNVNPI
ncbi:Phosphoribosyl 1,2-cyclic phosphodiesterase [Chitinophaga sancti]|uniref:Phosphoribosyl 1,2-cyclic phosphodiesterase n=2 Tax=Chitinophaga sancti TaxID=1004 RepID=A0A1K1M0C6_9BACT|nr:Phosphoribosyl 1,2-cyclic phosphodiesterase [Chitinophaga sancti]